MKTLDELKAMSDKELFTLWGAAEFPFELMPCGTCMTGHHSVFNTCHNPDHQLLRDRITAIYPDGLRLGRLAVNVEEFFALRLFHDDQYAPAKRVATQNLQQVKEKVNG